MSVAAANLHGTQSADQTAEAQPSLSDSLVLALAPGLTATRSLFRRQPRYVVSDPARASHAAVTPEIWSLLSSLKAGQNLTQVLQHLQLNGRPVPPLDTLVPVLARLRDIGLIKIISGVLPIPEAQKGTQPLEAQLVYFRREFIELMPLMPIANKMMGWIFTKFGITLWASLLAVSLYQVVGQFDRIENPLMWLSQLTAVEAFVLYAITIAIKAIHELSHAVAFQRMAAAEAVPVSSIRAGIAFMLFLPFPFTNCTGAWGISDKYRRATIGVAGMYVESWIALIALVIWSMTSNPIMSSLCLQIATIVGLSTLVFNLNPLAKLDGYYVMTDLTERPNLQGQALAAAMTFFQRLFKIQSVEKRPPAPERLLLLYWAAASLYRIAIFSGMIWLALSVGVWLAIPVALIACSLMIVRPLMLHTRILLAQSADRPATKRKLILSAAMAVILLCVIPFPAGRTASAVVEMDGAAFVYAPRDARVEYVASEKGAGTLLHLSDPELPLMRREIAARRSLAAVRYERALATSGDSPRNVDIARAITEEITGLDRQLDQIDQEADKLTASGTRADNWNPLRAKEYVGSWIARAADRPLGLRSARANMQVRALVEENYADTISAGQTLQIRLGNNHPFKGHVARVDQRASAQLPSAALGRNSGGTIALNPDDMSGRTARLKYVSVWIDISDLSARSKLHHGEIMSVRFSDGPRPLLWQLAETIPALIRAHTPV
jgi:putative peptide zinc metalloprotease protein